MMDFESCQFRNDLAKEIKETASDKRRDVLDKAKRKPEYWASRGERIGERQEEEILDEGLGILVKAKMLYHGSPVSGIDNFNHATEETVGRGIYFTSGAKDAIRYARMRTQDYGKEGDLPVIYEVLIENAKLLDLRKSENIRKILPDFKTFLEKICQDKNLDWIRRGVIENAINAIKNFDIHIGALKDVTANIGPDFSEYVESLGYDGLITFEGGEGENPEDHDTYLIFDSQKANIVQEHPIV